MKHEYLEIGQKYQHANGICIYVGDIMIDGELRATFIFNSSERTYIPLRSLYLIKPLDEKTQISKMESVSKIESIDESGSEFSDDELLEIIFGK